MANGKELFPNNIIISMAVGKWQLSTNNLLANAGW